MNDVHSVGGPTQSHSGFRPLPRPRSRREEENRDEWVAMQLQPAVAPAHKMALGILLGFVHVLVIGRTFGRLPEIRGNAIAQRVG